MILCSACLLGISSCYDRSNKLNEKVIKLMESEIILPVCPEQLGGLSTPRPAAEINDGQVKNINREDVTINFHRGAEEVLRLANLYGIKKAVLKQRSPSCGCGKIYDGTFSHTVVNGDGVTARLLKENNIEVISEEDL